MSDPPEQPKTTELPAVVVPNDFIKELRSGFGRTEERLDRVVTESIRTNTRLTRIEERVDEVETRIGRNSNRVREVSAHDLSQEADISRGIVAHQELSAKVDALAVTQDTQLAILGRLDKVASNPLVKTLGAMLITAAITWLAMHGVKVP